MKLRIVNSPNTSEADAAIHTSELALRQILSRNSAVKRVVSDIRRIHECNHFAEQIQSLIAKEGPTK